MTLYKKMRHDASVRHAEARLKGARPLSLFATASTTLRLLKAKT